MNTPAKMTDLAKLDTGLPESEKRAIHRRVSMVAALGRKWLLHPSNAPKRGTYNPMTGARLA